MKLIEQLEAPANIFVPCPAQAFAQVRVRNHCPACPHFSGFVDTEDCQTAAFASRYRVNCAHPIARRLTVVEV